MKHTVRTQFGNQDVCLDCHAGLYCDNSDGCPFPCKLCPLGQYQDKTKQSGCKNCGCGDSQTCNPTGGCEELSCNAGQFALAGTCNDCTAGFYCDDPNGCPAPCKACNHGKYVDNKKQTDCKYCPTCKVDEYCSTMAGCQKHSCGPGEIVVTGALCFKCPKGQYCKSQHACDHSCTACQTGMYQDQGGETGCKECPTGHFSQVCGLCPVGNREGCGGATAGFCSECYPGRYSNLQEKVCVDCPAQYFQVDTNQPNCTECPVGKYQNEAGSVFCEETPSGTTVRAVMRESDDGKLEVTYENVPCPAGKFSSASSAQGCEYCPQGKVQPESGKPGCDQCSSKQYIKTDETTGKPDNRTCLPCPTFGADCDGRERRYVGGYWHDEAIVNPDASSDVYACVTEGCPDAGSLTMSCKNGYGGPLCAVCEEQFTRQVKKCVQCGKPKWGLFVLCILVFGAVALLVIKYFVRKYAAYMNKISAFSHFKVLVSFVTVMSTVSTQFGVVWPDSFARALNGLSVLSLDFGVLAGLMCVANINFYQSLLCTTGTLIAIVLAICTYHIICKDGKGRAQGVFEIVYVLLFAYPIVSVKVVHVFSCHDVEYGDGRVVPYLRADYSLECYTSEWNAMAAYAGIWIVLYVIVFPLYVIRELLCLWHWEQFNLHGGLYDGLNAGSPWLTALITATPLAPLRSKKPMLAFLADDYKHEMPNILWEAEEMLRKLLLSVIGAFWSTTSTMLIATALLISLAFQLLHTHYSPFRSKGLNRLQQLSLTVLSLTYFIGLLLRTQAADESDADSIGDLLVVLLCAVFVAVAYGIWTEMQELQKWKEEVKTIKTNTAEDELYDPQLHDHIIAYEDLTLGKVLGEGAEGVVRAGTYDGHQVAIKDAVLSLMTMTPVSKQLFEAQDEAKFLLPLRHPNVVQVYGVTVDFDTYEVHCLTILELCTKGSLSDQLLDMKLELSWIQRVTMCLQVAQGLKFLHNKGIVHRDLKTDNVLVDDNGVCKLADFGLSKRDVQWDTSNEKALQQMELTANIGTPVYMAPELMTDHATVGPKSMGAAGAEWKPQLLDVYSFGVLLFVALSRSKPYQRMVRESRMNLWALRNKITTKDLRPDKDPQCDAALAEMPPEVLDLMRRCWDKDPRQRPPNFDQIAKKLDSILTKGEGALPGAAGDQQEAPVTNPMLAAVDGEAQERESSKRL
eukprot:g738.t1